MSCALCLFSSSNARCLARFASSLARFASRAGDIVGFSLRGGGGAFPVLITTPDDVLGGVTGIDFPEGPLDWTFGVGTNDIRDELEDATGAGLNAGLNDGLDDDLGGDLGGDGPGAGTGAGGNRCEDRGAEIIGPLWGISSELPKDETGGACLWGIGGGGGGG